MSESSVIDEEYIREYLEYVVPVVVSEGYGKNPTTWIAKRFHEFNERSPVQILTWAIDDRYGYGVADVQCVVPSQSKDQRWKLRIAYNTPEFYIELRDKFKDAIERRDLKEIGALVLPLVQLTPPLKRVLTLSIALHKLATVTVDPDQPGTILLETFIGVIRVCQE